MTAAQAFIAARREGRGLAAFPGTVPTTLDEAYAIQQAAIDGWDDDVAGWKVGRILGSLEAEHGANRFLGPIFAATVQQAAPPVSSLFPVFDGGFGALEVEIIAVVASDQPADKVSCTADEARQAISGLHIGIEIAGSPLAVIDALGPLASIAGFGNNAGLILGPEIADGLTRADADLRARTTIEGTVAGEADATRLPGGIWGAVAFALETAARLGRPLRAGQYISTGALTGVHAVTKGQVCTADFGDDGRLDCLTVPVTVV